MFWVMMAGIFPERYSEASARWPRPGLAAAKVASIAKRRRHASSRASRLATNSSNGIGRLRVHNPPGERKSGIPHSVEMPAPVKGIITDPSAIMAPSCSTPLRRSEAITGDNPRFQPNIYSTADQVAILLGRRDHTIDDDYLRTRSILPCKPPVPLSLTGRRARHNERRLLSTITILQRRIRIRAPISDANGQRTRLKKDRHDRTTRPPHSGARGDCRTRGKFQGHPGKIQTRTR